MAGAIGLSAIAEIGTRALASSAEAIAAVTALVERVTGIDIAVASEITADGRYVFRGIEKRVEAPVDADDAIPYPLSLCSRIHAGESPATVTDTREAPALWAAWLRLKEALGVDWDILAFCTRDIRLPDGTRFGTLCLHHTEPHSFTADEEALLEVLARLLGQEIARERAAAELAGAVAALAEAERRRVELAEELRHELRAPLQVIDGYAEAMLDGVVARDDEHVTLVRRESGRATQLLDDLADLARLEARLPGPPSAPLDASEVAIDMVGRLRPLASASGLELVLDVEPARVALERKRLEQFLVNLTRNAIRSAAGGGGTRVVLFVRRADGAVEVGVEDDGPGVAAAELPRLFERFFRGASARDAGSGSGLGLTIARGIVEAAGGRVAAELLEPHGLRVTGRLPVAEQADPGLGHPALQA